MLFIKPTFLLLLKSFIKISVIHDIMIWLFQVVKIVSTCFVIKTPLVIMYVFKFRENRLLWHQMIYFLSIEWNGLAGLFDDYFVMFVN